MSQTFLEKAVMQQLQSPQMWQQIGRQVTDAIRTGKTSTQMTIQVPAPPVTENRQRTNRHNPRFILKGVQPKTRKVK